MTGEAERLSAALAAELAANNRRLRKDPRTLPVRFHALKAMAASAAHCLEAFQDQREETLSIRLGAGAHALTLGKPVAVYPGKVRRGKEWDAFRSVNPHAVILNQREHDLADAIADAIRGHAEASRLLFSPGMLRESTILWDWDGRKCQSTPDARGPLGLVEVKTTKCADPRWFDTEAARRGYHAQCAFYGLAMEATDGIKPADYHIVAVESSRPHVVVVRPLSVRAIEAGERLCREWFARLRQCEERNEWPGYDGSRELDVPDVGRLQVAVDDEPVAANDEEGAE